MPLRTHIIDLDKKGWMVWHPLSCPQNLLDCLVTEVCRELQKPPAEGRFECTVTARGDSYILSLGDEVSREVEIWTTRRTGYHYRQEKMRPS